MLSPATTALFSSAFALYRDAFPRLLRACLPLLFIAELITVPEASDATSPLLLTETAYFFLCALANASALLVLLRVRFPADTFRLSFASLGLLLLTEAYIVLAASLAALFLVLPALWVLSATFIAPVYALAFRQWPITASASSAERMRGHLLPIAAFVTLYIVVIVTGGFATLYLPTPVAFIANLVLAVVQLGWYAVVVVVFDRLHPDQSWYRTCAKNCAGR